MVLRNILTRSGLISHNAGRQSYLNAICCCCSRQVNAARPKAVVNAVRTNRVNDVKASACWVNTVRPRIVNTARSYRTPVNTVRPRVVNTARSNRTSVNAARANGFNAGKPQHDDKGFVDSGCSRHMTGNIAYLSDFKQFDGGYVAFGGGAYGGKISGKGTLKTANLDFEDNIVPKESLTCLVAKATLDESMLWHRRLWKRTQNFCNQVLNPITKPLFMLHMDLFGPTFMSSLMHKKYCLVVTDDYSRFTWVFFLTTKDETKFKNKVVDDFCREKGIKREYSVARTPQQNGVAGRRNRTLIEAARTIYSLSSKTFRVYNTRSKRVEENLHIGFLENKPMIEGELVQFLILCCTSEGKQSSVAIMMPIWKDSLYFDSPTKNVDNDEPKTADDAQKQDEDGLNNENDEQERVEMIASSKCLYCLFIMKKTSLKKIPEIEPTSIAKALSDSSWVEAMQEELLQFKLQQVWILVDLPNRKKAIGTKWVFRNKKDERGIVIRNKAW
ncbi:putative ribonuclease H-like domain-containing protein [Tanacetum coccineum]|uniref:Ribonuclease H-like domain-containing protein n=1 Tax=Tanacetum coccineum TaxID=301880 RepID=A0ABQ5I442_9ASTR